MHGISFVGISVQISVTIIQIIFLPSMVKTVFPCFLKVDLDNIDEKEFPKVHDLEFLDCILEEGEMLYIPPKWWHYVRSLTISFSVTYWWSDTGSSAVS